MDGLVGRALSTGPVRGRMGGVGLVYGLWVGECVGVIPAPLAYQSIDWRRKLTTSKIINRPGSVHDAEL